MLDERLTIQEVIKARLESGKRIADSDVRKLLDLLTTVEAERDEARSYADAKDAELRRAYLNAEAAEARAEALARAVREWQDANRALGRALADKSGRSGSPRETLEERFQAADASLLALDVQESS